MIFIGWRGLGALAAAALLVSQGVRAETIAAAPMAPEADAHDGVHDFDFAMGSWKAHLKRLDKPLTGSTHWIEYEGVSMMHKVFGDRGNEEVFSVDSKETGLHWEGQTLRLYDPASHQWSILGIDAAHGALVMPLTVGQFEGKVGHFYDYEQWRGRWILVRYQWTDISPNAAQMIQSFSIDGGKTWEPNWICDLTR